MLSHSVLSNSFATPWTVAPRFPVHRDTPGKDTGVGCHFLLHPNSIHKKIKWIEDLNIYNINIEIYSNQNYNTAVVKTMVFPVVTYDCETWTIKKAEC